MLLSFPLQEAAYTSIDDKSRFHVQTTASCFDNACVTLRSLKTGRYVSSNSKGIVYMTRRQRNRMTTMLVKC